MRGRGFCPKVECSAESSVESRMFTARGPGAGDGADGWVVGGCVHVQEGVGGTAAKAGPHKWRPVSGLAAKPCAAAPLPRPHLQGPRPLQHAAGTGNLTRHLLAAGAVVTAVEKDYALHEQLEREYAQVGCRKEGMGVTEKWRGGERQRPAQAAGARVGAGGVKKGRELGGHPPPPRQTLVRHGEEYIAYVAPPTHPPPPHPAAISCGAACAEGGISCTTTPNPCETW